MGNNTLYLCHSIRFRAPSPKLSRLLLTTTCWDGLSWYFYFQLTGFSSSNIYWSFFIYPARRRAQRSSRVGVHVYAQIARSLAGDTDTAAPCRTVWWAPCQRQEQNIAGTQGEEQSGQGEVSGTEGTRSGLGPCYSTCGLQTASSQGTGELGRNADSGPTPNPLIRNLHFHKTPGTPPCPWKVEEHKARWFMILFPSQPSKVDMMSPIL